MTRHFTNIKTAFSILTIAVLFSACGNKAEETDDIVTDNTTDIALDSQKISAQNVFNAIPGRTEIINLTQQAQAEYNAQVLNNPDDVNTYSLESSKALNLGVYGSDLNVTGVFEQTQESMLFLKCVNILAKSLGVSNAFDEKMVDRMEANKENRDSTLDIISQSFRNADSYLKANGRPGTSSLIVAGAWIEGIYTACNTAKETKSEAVIKEIFAQKESLRYLVELLEASKISEDSKYIIADLSDLKKTLDAKADNVFTPDALREVDSKATALRTKVISSK
jgi:hypothetical protein